jgi:hypothetical protein
MEYFPFSILISSPYISYSLIKYLLNNGITGMNKIRILICDDHALIRTGLISTLSNEPGIFIVGEAENGCPSSKLCPQ